MPLGTASSSTIVSEPFPSVSTELDWTTTVWPPAELSNPGTADIDSTSPSTGAWCGVPFLTSANRAG